MLAAAVGLVVLLPLLPILLLARGDRPLFARHRRVGARPPRSRFDQILLGVHADDGELTRLGRRLRSTRLEGWPQLLNVWRGEMSLVGPRAVDPECLATILRSVSAPARRRLALRSVRPGVFGSGPRRPPGCACPFTALRDRVLFDLPWDGDWSDEPRGPGADVAALTGDLRGWLARPRASGNELVRWDLPRRFEHLPLDPRDVPRLTAPPALEVEDDASGVTAFWYPHRGDGLEVPERGRFDMALVDELADDVHHERDRGLVVERGLARAGDPEHVDRLVIELPAGLHAIERVCAALHPIWSQLAPRARDGAHFAWDLHVLLLESAAFVARLGPSGQERIAVEVRVHHDRVALRVALAGPSAGLVLSDSKLRELIRPLGLLEPARYPPVSRSSGP